MATMVTKTREREANPWLVLLVLCLGFFMILLDTTIVNIAIPAMLKGLHSSLDQILWVLNAYLLAYAVLLITAGRLGDIWGPRTLFMIGLVIFTLASAACGLAQDSGQMISARVVQGLGGALLAPQTLTIITSIFPPQRRGAAMGIWGSVAGLATIAGPTLGGFLVADVDWRWIFFVNVPVGAVALAGALTLVPDLRPGRRHRLDLVGVVLASLGLFCIVFGLIEGQRYDWGAFWGPLTIPETLAAGGLFLAAFLAWEAKQAEPLVPLILFRNRNFTIVIWIASLIAFGMFGFFIPSVIFFQSVLGMDALRAGLTFAPMSLVSMLVAPIAGRLADRVGGKYLLMAGLGLFAVGMALVISDMSLTATNMTFLLPTLVAGLGLGLTFAPMITEGMRDIEPHMAGAASGILNTARQVGGAVGSAIIGAVLQNRLATALHDQAQNRAAQMPIPPDFRDRFVDAFSHAAKGGFQVAPGQSGGAPLPGGIPASVATMLQNAAHDVFTHAYIDAARPTLAVSIAVLGLGAISCLAMAGRRRTQTAPEKGDQAVGTELASPSRGE